MFMNGTSVKNTVRKGKAVQNGLWLHAKIGMPPRLWKMHISLQRRTLGVWNKICEV